MVLKVDTRSHLQELIRDFSELDMNEDPEVAHIHDPNLRQLKAKAWLDSRIAQLGQGCDLAELELDRALTAGYLPRNDYSQAVREYRQAFEQLKVTARTKFNEAVYAQPKISGTMDDLATAVPGSY